MVERRRNKEDKGRGKEEGEEGGMVVTGFTQNILRYTIKIWMDFNNGLS